MNYINSLVQAKKRDISVFVNKKETKYENYLSALEIVIRNDKNEQFKVIGIIGTNGEERIVNADDYFVDIIISDNMVLLKNNDVPGVIGVVGKILGEENVNIATMCVGRKKESAIMLLTVDEPVKKSSLIKLNEAEQIKWAFYLELK